MEQHPVPQNVTSFQFKLIGDITLKQFAYLAGGVILGYLSLKISLIPSLLRYPVGGFFALLGIGLAFVPIEERPLDRWLMAFVKSIYAPTQFVWKKDNPPPEILQTMSAAIVQTTPAASKPAPLVEIKPQTPARMTIPSSQTAVPTPPPKPAVPKIPPLPPQSVVPIKPPPELVDLWAIGAPVPKATVLETTAKPISQVTGKRVVFEEKKPAAATGQPADTKQAERIKASYEQATQKLNHQIQSLQKELAEGTIAKERLMELQQVLMQLAGERERLSRELVDLKQKMVADQNQPTVRPTAYTTTPQDTHTTVKMVTPQAAVRTGIPHLTTIPNVVTGIVKNSKGALLPNLIVMVKDRDGVPVRALKTNKLGQFAASTPLSPGTYILEIEDPKKFYRFQRIEVTLTNQVLPPLEIYAISEKDLLRQKLTQEIFGGNGL